MDSQSTEVGKPSSSSKASASKRRFRGLVWFILIALFLGSLSFVLGVLFINPTKKSMPQSPVMRLAQMQQQLLQVQKQCQALQENVDWLQSVVRKRVLAQDATVRIDRADQLIHLAYYSLVYLHDPTSALSALRTAKAQVIALQDQSFTTRTLENALSQDIALLEGMPRLDFAMVLAKLHRLQDQVTQLRWRGDVSSRLRQESSVHATDLSMNSRKTWLQAFQSSLGRFQQLVVIRHLDRPIEPLLPQIQQQYLQQNMQLLLQQTQWALLQGEELLYQSSLQEVQKAVRQYFAQDTPTVQAMLRELEELQKIRLRPELPDLSHTLVALASVEETVDRHSQDRSS